MASFDQRERWHAIDRTWQHPTELVIESVTAALPTLLPFGAREQEFYRFLRDIENWGTRNDKLQLLKDDKKGQLKCTTDCFLTPSEWLCCIEKETVLSVDHRLTIGWPDCKFLRPVELLAACLKATASRFRSCDAAKIREDPWRVRSTYVNIIPDIPDILWYTVIYLTWQVTMQLVRLVTSYSRVRRSRRSWLHNAEMQYRHTSACSRQAISQCGKLWQVQGLGAVCQ